MLDAVLDSFSQNAAIIGISPENLSVFTHALKSGLGGEIALNGSKCGVRLTDEGVGQLVLCLQQSNVPIRSLSLTYHNLTDDSIEFIRDSLLIGGSTSLDHLDLEGNDITVKGLKFLQLNNSELCPLASLNLSGNPIQEKGGLAISEALLTNMNLRSLKLNNCGFNLTAIVGIAAGLAGGSRQIQELEIDRPVLPKYVPGEESSDHFSRVLGGAKSLKTLSLRHHNIGDGGARLLAYNLNKASQLLCINLECNKIGIAGAEALASYLIIQAREQEKAAKPSSAIGDGRDKQPPAVGLQQLLLSYNPLGDQGAAALADAIKVNRTLRTLTLKNGNVKDAGLMAIGKALEENNTLQALSLFGNDFDNNETGQLFHEMIQHRLPYVGLSLDIKTYVVDGKYMIAEQS